MNSASFIWGGKHLAENTFSTLFPFPFYLVEGILAAFLSWQWQHSSSECVLNSHLGDPILFWYFGSISELAMTAFFIRMCLKLSPGRSQIIKNKLKTTSTLVFARILSNITDWIMVFFVLVPTASYSPKRQWWLVGRGLDSSGKQL